MTKRIMLRVQSEIDCPLFRAGDQMVLELPGIDVPSSSNVCSYAIAKFLSEHAADHCEDLETDKVQEFHCPRSENPVLFSVETLAPRLRPTPLASELLSSIPQAVAHLRSINIFRALSAHFLGQLAHRIRIEAHRDADMILQKGYPADALYTVHSGQVEVIGYADHDVSSVVTRLKPGDCFGEVSLLTGAPAVASVVARGEVELLVIDRSDFELMLRENTFMASRFTRLLATRLMAANFLLVQEGSKSFSGKIAVMNLVTVLQVLADSTRSGTLVVESEGLKAEVCFNEGHIFEVITQHNKGEEALYEILAWTTGEFWLDENRIPTEDTVEAGVMGLLMEGMRRLDEAARNAELNGGTPAAAGGTEPPAKGASEDMLRLSSEDIIEADETIEGDEIFRTNDFL